MSGAARAPGPVPGPGVQPADAQAALPEPVQRFVQQVRQALAGGVLLRLQLARPHPPAEASLRKLLLRPVQLRGQAQLQYLWRHATQDITKHLPQAEALAQLGGLVVAQFHHAHLVTPQRDVQLLLDRKGRWALRSGKVQAAPGAAAAVATSAATSVGTPLAAPLAASAVAGGFGAADADAAAAADPAPAAVAGPAPAGEPARPARGAAPLSLHEPWLAALGIADAHGRLVPAMARKWRQITKFCEIVAGALDASPLAARPPQQPVRVLDFGAGKGYLTFALYRQLQAAGRAAQVTGVELRSSLTEPCNAIARAVQFDGLHFAAGDVRSHAAEGVDIMIALHACDTATDVAMHRGIAAGAAIIVCSPCCHKELRPQIQVPEVLRPVLRDGIHLTATAEMLTDSLRALLLRLHGYDAQVFEFISPEHTGKNRMVLAVRRSQPLPRAQQAQLAQQLQALKAFYGIRSQYLDALLQADAEGRPAPPEPLPRLPAGYRNTEPDPIGDPEPDTDPDGRPEDSATAPIPGPAAPGAGH